MKKAASALLAVTFSIAFAAGPAAANPVFSHTESGSIRIEENGSVYDIYSADRSIGAFDSFSNAAGETINSFQPSPDSSVLFRVTGGDPSAILGAFNANSRVFLVNPNGVLFGPGSSVNAPGLVASTLNLSNDDFLASNYAFTAVPGTNGLVANLGALRGGYVVLLGRAVRNEGLIEAPGGTAALAAGDSARLLLDSEGLVSIDVDAAAGSGVLDADGNRVADQVYNSGVLSADGGAVLVTARAAEGVFDNVINHSGVAQARSVGVENGIVTLYGGDEGVVCVTGTIDASGKGAGETGGKVRVLGDKVGLFDQAKIDVSGDAGGGEALIGGDYQGKNEEIPNASFVTVSKDAIVDARAIRTGDGGRVIAWADEATRFHGAIDVRGGAESGDGGFVETSGHDYLDVELIRVYASAEHGRAGEWLLDPLDITIAVSADTAISDDNGSVTRTFRPTGSPSVLSVSTLNGALNAGTNVIVKTTGTTGGGSGDIFVNAAVSQTSGAGNFLKLDAAGSIDLSGGSITLLSGTDLYLYAGAAINGNSTNGLAEITMGGDLDLIADRIGDVNQLEINLTAAGGETFVLDHTGSPAGHDVDMEVLGDNFSEYDVTQASVLTTISLDLPGLDGFSATGGAMVVTLDAIAFNTQPITPDLFYTQTGTGDVLLGTITVSSDLSIAAEDGDIADSSSSISANDLLLYASGDVGTPAVKLQINGASSVTAIGGGLMGLSIQGSATLETLVADGSIGVSATGSLTVPYAAILSDDDTKDIDIAGGTGLSLGIIRAGNGTAGDITLNTGSGNITDANGDDVNLVGDILALSAPSGSIGTNSNFIEATFNTLNPTAANGVFVTRVFPSTGGTGGLTIQGGRIVGGENISEYTSSLYGEEGTEEEGEEEESEESADAGQDAGAAGGSSSTIEEPPAEDAPPPVEAKAFQPCGV